MDQSTVRVFPSRSVDENPSCDDAVDAACVEIHGADVSGKPVLVGDVEIRIDIFVYVVLCGSGSIGHKMRLIPEYP